jgi:hypothetical protein
VGRTSSLLGKLATRQESVHQHPHFQEIDGKTNNIHGIKNQAISLQRVDKIDKIDKITTIHAIKRKVTMQHQIIKYQYQ